LEQHIIPSDRTVRKIVQTRPGPGTGDTIYVDEYGGTWVTQPYPSADMTDVPLIGRVVGNKILTGKRKG
jgi:hypothetical protein